jgi:hypothetical protein
VKAYYFSRAFFLTFCLSIVALSGVLGGETKISGTTFVWEGTDTYKFLPNVKITVTRQGSIVWSGNSDPQGHYSLEVRSGEPINVVFYLAHGFVPESQSLSAGPRDDHRVSTALMTTAQYKQLKGVAALEQKVNCVLMLLPENSDAAATIRSSLTHSN